jgi:cbb3-type cytochrome oxidase subunit 1
MTPYVKLFLKASLTWLVIGVTVGLLIAMHPVWTVYRTAHLHMLALGFITMMIYGVAYHVVPRFSGFPLPSERAPMGHWWMSNVGLLLLVAGFACRANGIVASAIPLAVGGSLSAAGAYVFAWAIWRTIDGPSRQQAALPVAPAGPVLVGVARGVRGA